MGWSAVAFLQLIVTCFRTVNHRLPARGIICSDSHMPYFFWKWFDSLLMLVFHTNAWNSSFLYYYTSKDIHLQVRKEVALQSCMIWLNFLVHISHLTCKVGWFHRYWKFIIILHLYIHTLKCDYIIERHGNRGHCLI